MEPPMNILHEIRAKVGINEETEKLISRLQSGKLGVNHSMDIKIPVTNGFGTTDLGPYSNPFPWQITVHATGWIVSPENGTWRIRIMVNGDAVFDQSEISAKQKFSASVALKGWSSAKVHVDAIWSEKANTNLSVHVEGSV
jgi:hypothetical protein